MEKLNNTDTSFEYSLNVCRFKIVFVGDVNVGKSSIINRINDNPFKEEYEVKKIKIYKAINRSRFFFKNFNVYR